MKEREKMFTAVLVLIISIILTGFVIYQANFFGIRTLIHSPKGVEMGMDSDTSYAQMPEDLRKKAEDISQMFLQGKYSEIYDNCGEKIRKNGSKEEFIDYCKRGAKNIESGTESFSSYEEIAGEDGTWKVVYENEKTELDLFFNEDEDKKGCIEGFLIITKEKEGK